MMSNSEARKRAEERAQAWALTDRLLWGAAFSTYQGAERWAEQYTGDTGRVAFVVEDLTARPGDAYTFTVVTTEARRFVVDGLSDRYVCNYDTDGMVRAAGEAA